MKCKFDLYVTKQKHQHLDAGVLIKSAPERTRTSTPVRAQVLNLPRMPIPPLGHLESAIL